MVANVLRSIRLLGDSYEAFTDNKQHKSIPIEMLVNNEGTCIAVRGHCAVSDERLNIEMSRAREYRHEDEIAVNWIPSVEQIADPLNKKTANSLEIIRTVQGESKPRRKIEVK